MVSPTSGDQKERQNIGLKDHTFPIKWCHQRVVTGKELTVEASIERGMFPIKWCHQRVVTVAVAFGPGEPERQGFQLSGVTNEW